MTTTMSWQVPLTGVTAEKVAQLKAAVESAIGSVLGQSALLDGASVSKAGTDASKQGWTTQAYKTFLDWLRLEGGAVQADVLEVAVENGGVIDRADVFEVAEWDPKKRSLKGFTRPINRVVAKMKEAGLLDPSSPSPISPQYLATKKGYQRAHSFSVPADLLPIFADE